MLDQLGYSLGGSAPCLRIMSSSIPLIYSWTNSDKNLIFLRKNYFLTQTLSNRCHPPNQYDNSRIRTSYRYEIHCHKLPLFKLGSALAAYDNLWRTTRLHFSMLRNPGIFYSINVQLKLKVTSK